MRPDGFNIQRRIERLQPLLIQLNSGFEKAFSRAGYDDADVDELLTLDFGNNADDGVVIGAEIAHEWPPPGMDAVAPTVSTGTWRNLSVAHRSHR